LTTKVLSHCSIFDQVYGPSIVRFHRYLNETGRHNYSLFIYDGELLSPSQLDELVEAEDGSVVILHHQELAPLLSSNFQRLGAA
jgi:sensor domain CHASE-containing protein